MTDNRNKLRFLSQIHTASRQVGTYLSPICDQLGIAPQEGHVLSFLWKYPSRVSVLQNVFGFPASTLTSLLDRLEKNGRITRTVDPEDRRSFIIETTPEGARIAHALAKAIEEFEDRVMAGITPEDYEAFLRTLASIADVTNVKLRD